MAPQRYEDIDVRIEGHIEVLTLRRPEVRNALRHQTFAELEAAVLATSARVLIVTGEDPAFCSGDDVRAIMGSGQQRERVRRTPRLTPAADALLYTDTPVIAAVNGAAVGWGMELANLPLAVRAIKQGLRSALDPDWASLGRWVSETLEQLFDTEDHREGVRAFLEKRQPTFVGG